NESGIKQAQACGVSLLQNEWDLIITSPLLRAKETGKIIQQKLNIPLHEMTSFIEVAFGDAEGLTYYERDVRFPNRDYPNKETEEMINESFLKGIRTVQQNYTNKNILNVYYCIFINILYYYFF